jgi:hypothetical protein
MTGAPPASPKKGFHAVDIAQGLRRQHLCRGTVCHDAALMKQQKARTPARRQPKIV